jgi:hypothetical protein
MVSAFLLIGRVTLRLASAHFSTQTVRRDSLLIIGVTAMLENSPLIPPNCGPVANPKA